MRHEPAPAGIPLELALAATYSRVVRAGIERIWENVLDWEHLPALHDIYFNHVALIEIEGEPEQYGRDIRPVVHQEHEEPVVQGELERAASADLILPIVSRESLLLMFVVGELYPGAERVELCNIEAGERPERLGPLREPAVEGRRHGL